MCFFTRQKVEVKKGGVVRNRERYMRYRNQGWPLESARRFPYSFNQRQLGKGSSVYTGQILACPCASIVDPHEQRPMTIYTMMMTETEEEILRVMQFFLSSFYART